MCVNCARICSRAHPEKISGKKLMVNQSEVSHSKESLNSNKAKVIGITHATSTKSKKLIKMSCRNILDTIAARKYSLSASSVSFAY